MAKFHRRGRENLKIFMPETYFIVPKEKHDALVKKAYLKRGYDADEAAAGARFCSSASYYGIRTHNAIKALHLDELFGSKVGRWKPGAKIEKIPSRFAAAKSGTPTASSARPSPTTRWTPA